jgi:hypothetical protein
MPNIKTATVHCNITEEDKEKEGAFNVELLHEGNLIYERDHWGLTEEWGDGTAHSTTSSNISHRNEPAIGTYTLKVMIDGGVNIDVDANWSIEILTTDGETFVSDPYQYQFNNDIREFQTSYSF